jgi:propanol-preferring alcohol dehydrogenase
MKAAQWHAYGEPLVLEEVPKPEPGPGELVIKIAGAGVCHSDVHRVDGTFRRQEWVLGLPFILGHENAGHVEAVGGGVTTVAEGDAVVVLASQGCGKCTYCIRSLQQYCPERSRRNGTGIPGGYAEYMLVAREQHVIKLRNLDPAFAATLTDAGITSYSAVKNAQPFFDPEVPVLVIGVGGLGGYCVKYLHAFTRSPIIAVDVGVEKLERAREYGAVHALDGREPDLQEQIMALTDGHGVCVAFDFVGVDSTLETMFRSTRAGGKAVHIGLGGGVVRMDVTADLRLGLTYQLHIGGTIKELREVVALFEAGLIEPLPTDYLPLDDINVAFERVRTGDVPGRLVVVP